jgi:hypothetical protein
LVTETVSGEFRRKFRLIDDIKPPDFLSQKRLQVGFSACDGLSFTGDHPTSEHDPSSDEDSCSDGKEYKHDLSSLVHHGISTLAEGVSHATPEQGKGWKGCAHCEGSNRTQNHEYYISFCGESEEL